MGPLVMPLNKLIVPGLFTNSSAVGGPPKYDILAKANASDVATVPTLNHVILLLEDDPAEFE
jgi:hypothetical protein